MNEELLIFDFDGVLAHSEDVLFEALNYALKKFRMHEITKEEFLSHSKVELLTKRKISKLKLFFLVMIAKKYMRSNNHRIKKNNDVLNLLKENYTTKFIVSSNAEYNIRQILGDDSKYFEKIIGNIGLYEKHKILKKMNKNSKYFTDEVRDIQSCRKVGIPVFAVTWGVDSKAVLEKENPDALIESPDQLTLYL